MSNNQSTIVWSYTTAFWMLVAVCLLLVGFAFHDTIGNMEKIWSESDEYGYGYLIPVISVFFIWQRKSKLAAIDFRSSPWGIMIIMAGGIFYFLGAIATTHTLSQYGLILTIIGIALGLMGWRAFKFVAVPLLLLFFMVPLPQFLFAALSTKLQLVSSLLGVDVIRLFGISVYLEGNVIDLGSYKLQVVEACSGLRYLFPLVSLSFIAAYIFRGAVWKKVLIFLSSMPITVLMNSLRIGIIGVLVEYGGVEQAEGFLHYFEGWVIFMACMAILIVEMAVLAKIGAEKKSLADVFAIDLPEPAPAAVPRKDRQVGVLMWTIPVLLAVIAVSSMYVQGRENILPERRVFAEFPSHVDDWRGAKGTLEDNILASLKTEDYIISDYRNAAGHMVNFYIAYYADQAAGSAAHSPRACIPGGGWLIRDFKVIPVEDVVVNGRPIMANRLLIKRGEYTRIVYYWFQQRGRNITSIWLVKWYLFWDAMTRSRTDGALVRLTALVFPGEDVAAADARLVEFAKAVSPYLQEYIPD